MWSTCVYVCVHVSVGTTTQVKKHTVWIHNYKLTCIVRAHVLYNHTVSIHKHV